MTSWECLRGLYECTVLQNELKRFFLKKKSKTIYDWTALFFLMPVLKERVWINHCVFQQLDAIKNVELVFVKEMNSNRNAVVINETVSFKLQGVLDTASFPVHDLTISSGIGRRVVRVQSFALVTMQEVIMEYVPELFVDKRCLTRFLLPWFFILFLISDIVSAAWHLRNRDIFSWSAKPL